MFIRTTCPNCGQRLRAAGTQAGKQRKCPACAHPVIFPQTDLNNSTLQEANTPPLSISEPPISTADEPAAITNRLEGPVIAVMENSPAVVSLIWLCILLSVNPLHSTQIAVIGTVSLIVANSLLLIWSLIWKKRTLVLPIAMLLCLVTVLNYQVYSTFGSHHYQFDQPPRFYHWVQYIGIHILRVVDVVDFVEEYGIDFQNIKHNSTLTGLVLVFLHLMVALFLAGLIFSRLEVLWSKSRDSQSAGASQEEVDSINEGIVTFIESLSLWFRNTRPVALAGCIVLYVFTSDWENWGYSNYVLWPVDNILRTVDFVDLLHIFHWRLHQVTPGFWNSTLSVFFRLIVGAFIAEQMWHLRFTVFRGVGMTREELLKALEDDNPEVRTGAEEALSRLGNEAVPILVAALAGKETRTGAAKALSRIGREVVPALVKGLRAEEEIRAGAAEALGLIGPDAEPAVPGLVKALEDSSHEVRKNAAEALGRIQPEPARAVPGLLNRLIEDSDGPCRQAAILALARIDPDSDEVLTAILSAVKDENKAVRLEAVKALDQIGAKSLETISALAQTLDDEDTTVRLEAALVLNRRGSDAKPALRALCSALAQKEYALRVAVLKCLGQFGPEALPALGAIKAILTDPNKILRLQIVRTLAQLGPQATSILIQLLEDKDNDVRCEVVKVLGSEYGPQASEAVPALIRRFEDNNEQVRKAVSEALGRIGEDAVPALIRVLTRTNRETQRLAIEALGRIGPPAREAVPLLIEVLIEMPEPYKGAVIHTLGRIGPDAQLAIPVLSKLTSTSLRRAAVAALHRIDPETNYK